MNIQVYEKMGISKFKRLRKEMNLTQSELAEKVGMKKNYIVRHEQHGIPIILSLAMSALYIKHKENTYE
jgi:DNA-binding XRE family transcriptional regulator